MVQVIRKTRTTPASGVQIITPQQSDAKMLIGFINASFTGTGQEEYYNSKKEQRASLFAGHKPVLEKYREFYALLLVSTINDLNKQIIIFNLLKHGSTTPIEQKEFENKLIMQALNGMHTNRAYNALELLADNKVNNKRTRKVVSDFLTGRKNYKYEFVKYKTKVKKIITHNHLYKNNEVWDFLFDKKKTFDEVLFNDYMKAKSDVEAAYRLPYSIAEGFASFHKIDRKTFLSKIKDQMTDREKQRLTTSAKEAGVKLEADWTKASLRDMYIYLYSLTRKPNKVEEVIDTRAALEAKNIPYYYEKVALVIDNSASSYGSEEKKYHPIASQMAIAKVLSQLSDTVEWVYTNDAGYRLGALQLPEVGGDTNLASALMKALHGKPDAVFILTDGYENVVSGAAAQLINAFKRQLDKDNKVLIMQISSVFAAESGTVRQLSELAPNMGIRDHGQLGGVLLLGTMEHNKERTLEQFMTYLKGRVKEIPNKTYLLEG